LPQRNEKKKEKKFMSLDNIQLSDQMCAILYPNTLTETKNKKSEVKIETDDSIDSLGQNKSRILFVVNNPAHKFLSDDEMDLLAKLLTACNLSMAEIALVNYHFNKNNYQ
jgi:hypothetical protein